jgi:ComF family protein
MSTQRPMAAHLIGAAHLFGVVCAGCGAPGAAVLCPGCRESVPRPVASPRGGVIAALSYRGTGKQLVAGLKFRNRRHAAHSLAELLAARLATVQVDVVTWAPTSARRRRSRGYDQAELVARALARRLGLPCRRLLRRVPGPPQTGRSRSQRLAGPAFVARPSRRPLRVLLIDDVVTTGATLASAGRALRAAGASHVVLAAAAATPPPPAQRSSSLARPLAPRRQRWLPKP